MDDLGRVDMMDAEWNGWQLVVQELRALGIEPNDEGSERLVRSVQAWGELLTELRLSQPENVVKEARMQACLAVLNLAPR